jgi:hypothetical protein
MGLKAILIGMAVIASTAAGDSISSQVPTLSLSRGGKLGSASKVSQLRSSMPASRTDSLRLRGGGNPVVFFDMTIGGQKAGKSF